MMSDSQNMEEKKKDSRGKCKEHQDGDSSGGSRGASARATPISILNASAGQSSSAPSSRPLSPNSTPKPVGKKITYSRDQLILMKDWPLSQPRHQSLSPEYLVDDGKGDVVWDTDKWFRSFDRTASPAGSCSSVGAGSRQHKMRGADISSSRDSLLDGMEKRRPTDAKSRVKEGDDIILGPQRQSFTTGCHVRPSQLSRGGRPTSPIDTESRGGGVAVTRDRRDKYVGSGRIALGNERGVGGGEGRGGGGGDYRAPRDLGTRETLREKARISEEREVGGGGGGGRTYSRRDSDRNMRESDYGLDNRTGNSRYRNTNYRGNHPRRDEQEPEWYSSGPVSQSDTIELHGFEPSSSSTEEKGGWDEEQERDERDSRNYKERQPPSYVFKNSKQEAQQRDQQQQQQQQEEEAYYDEREEPSHCSSPPLNQQQPPQTTQPQQQGNFDLEQYFRSDGGSGVADHIQALLSATEPVSAGGSRFMQFFNNMDGGGAAEPMSWAAVAAAPAGQRSVPAQAQADLAPKNASAPQDAKPRGPRAPRGERTGREAGRNPPVEGQEQQQQQQQQPRQAQQKYADAQQLFVANIAQNIEEQELWAFFEREFGRVLKVRIKRKNVGARDNAQAVPNFGFVVFESPDSVALALTRRPLIFHNATGDHRLNIEEKKQRSERPNSGNRIGGRQNGNMGGRGGMGPRGNGRGGPARGSNRGGGYAARR